MFQRKLYNDLMMNYNRLERPVLNDSAPIVVELGFTLRQIIDVVSPNLRASVCVWMCWCFSCESVKEKCICEIIIFWFVCLKIE